MAEGNEQKVNSTATIGRHKQRLGELIDLIGTISLLDSGSSSGRESAQTSPADDQSRLTSAATIKERKTHRSGDLLGRVYEYFLTRFASAEGKNGGQFYTPSCVVRCLVEPVPVRKDLAPYKGRIYDPACGSGGMFVQSEKFVESHGGTAARESAKQNCEATSRDFCEAKDHRGDISIYGQESNATAWRLTKISFGLKRLRPQRL